MIKYAETPVHVLLLLAICSQISAYILMLLRHARSSSSHSLFVFLCRCYVRKFSSMYFHIYIFLIPSEVSPLHIFPRYIASCKFIAQLFVFLFAGVMLESLQRERYIMYYNIFLAVCIFIFFVLQRRVRAGNAGMRTASACQLDFQSAGAENYSSFFCFSFRRESSCRICAGQEQIGKCLSVKSDICFFFSLHPAEILGTFFRILETYDDECIISLF